jgi:putative methylase
MTSAFGSKKQLAVFLSKLEVFAEADPRLEQYPTDSEVAASVLWAALMQGDIEEKTVADFGCGTGILGIGALALGAKHVTFIDIDQRVLPPLMANLHRLEEELDEELSNYEIVTGNVSEFRLTTVDGRELTLDTVLQNPPFGTRDEHADVQFIEAASRLSSVIYSLHKTSTLQYLRRFAQTHALTVSVEWPFSFPLKATMAHHTKRLQRIDVTCLRLVRDSA